MDIIDLRSDTVTKPTPAMLEAMMNAVVGDDVFNEDPTIKELQNFAARMFGMEAALYCPSGTMTNQIALKLHTQPGDEIICDELSHIYHYEGGGIGFNSGCSVKMLQGDRGRFTAEDVLANLNDPDDIHKPLSRLVVIENTCNKGGGSIWDIEAIRKIRKACDERGLKLHMDGARLFNALVETGEDPKEYGKLFDTISICLSKGLGAPVGSLLIGSEKAIKQAKRIRKVFGGGMRQAGYIAAGGLYALKNHIERLREDHERARKLGKTLEKLAFVKEVLPIETNILVFKLSDKMPSEKFIKLMNDSNIKVVPFGHQTIRMVTHLDVDEAQMEKVSAVLEAM